MADSKIKTKCDLCYRFVPENDISGDWCEDCWESLDLENDMKDHFRQQAIAETKQKEYESKLTLEEHSDMKTVRHERRVNRQEGLDFDTCGICGYSDCPGC